MYTKKQSIALPPIKLCFASHKAMLCSPQSDALLIEDKIR